MKRFNIKRLLCKPNKIEMEKGFTVLELLFAITILSVGILAVASMQAASIQGNAFAGGVTLGTTWAADKLEGLIALAYYDYSNSDLEDSDTDGDGGLEDTGSNADHQETQGDYTIYWNVSEDSVMSNTKTINVIVVWTERDVQRNVSMRYVVPRVS